MAVCYFGGAWLLLRSLLCHQAQSSLSCDGKRRRHANTTGKMSYMSCHDVPEDHP